MAANFPTVAWGITAPQYRHPSRARENLTINSKEDDKPVLINSRDYAQASGTSIGFQSKPNQAVSGASVHGCEIQPRFADGIGGGSLVGANISAILKGTTGNLTGEVHALEVETDFNAGGNPTRTITGDVSLIRISGDFPGTMTFSGKKNVITIAPQNSGAFDYFLNLDSSQTALLAAKTNAAITHTIPIRFGNTNYWIMVSNAQ